MRRTRPGRRAGAAAAYRTGGRCGDRRSPTTAGRGPGTSGRSVASRRRVHGPTAGARPRHPPGPQQRYRERPTVSLVAPRTGRPVAALTGLPVSGHKISDSLSFRLAHRDTAVVLGLLVLGHAPLLRSHPAAYAQAGLSWMC